MKKQLQLTIALVAILAGSVIAVAQSAHPKHLTSKSTKSKTSPDSNPNIKVATATNVAGKPQPNHSKKGGKHRGATQNYFHVDNQTGYYVTLFLDGANIGTVAPYGDSYGWEPAGSHTVYGNAPGTTITFGPSTVFFNDGESFTWTLTP
jgi:hypothetical protein